MRLMAIRLLPALLLAGAAVLDAGAQARWGSVPESPSRRPSPAPADAGRPFAATPYRGADQERCANFRKELREARRRERQAGTTTGADQASMDRQRILETMHKAGC